MAKLEDWRILLNKQKVDWNTKTIVNSRISWATYSVCHSAQLFNWENQGMKERVDELTLEAE